MRYVSSWGRNRPREVDQDFAHARRFPLFAKGAPFLARSIDKQAANISLSRKICPDRAGNGANRIPRGQIWQQPFMMTNSMNVCSKRQERLVQFLESPSSYPHRPREVRSIQTHSSWVFIASPFVFKVKKPVNLGFLDFSTLEKRHHFCQRELELNRRLCPEVYLGVLPIYASGDGFSFKADGELAEYTLKMKELPKGWFLRELLAKELVGETEINRVISCLHRFYEAQTPRPEVEEWGTPEKLKISTDENFAQVEAFAGKTISPVAFEAIRHFTNAFYVANKRLFHARIQEHRIRDCHGDLHLDHIHITPEATAIFDCIEFNDRFRFIDIANDLAFLAMDFDFEGKPELGNLFLQNAAREFSDPGLQDVANFYKCYRAFVRGKVETIQTTSVEASTAQEHAKRAIRYFRLALRYAIGGSEPLVLVVMGRVGTGKSTVAKQLGNELDWPVFSSDRIRKILAGLPLAERTAPELRKMVYSKRMTDQTYKELVELGLAALVSDGGIILDATFSSRAKRDYLRAECARAHVPLQVIELEAEKDEIANRLKERGTIAEEVSDARLEDLETLTAAYEPPLELAPDLIKVGTSCSVPERAAKSVLLRLTEIQISKSGRR
jgi:aminoglycoside phosphotransferase family enzyme/predicted kinase